MFELLDTAHLGRPGVICPGVAGDSALALIDCGPDTLFEETLRALRARGFRPEQVTDVLVTHIHLDHSGGAWRWATEFGAMVAVHPRGAPHLADPTKLLASAGRVFGDRMERLWGELRPVPAERLRVVHDGEWVGSKSARFRAIETPGHAPHHHAYWHEESQSIYAGDVAGVKIAGGPLLPPCPPPDINIEAWRASLDKLRALQPARILLPHAAILPGVGALAEMEKRLGTWSDWVLERLRGGQTAEQMVPAFERFVWDELRAAGVSEDGLQAYEQCDPAAMSVYGLERYWNKHHPELVPHRAEC